MVSAVLLFVVLLALVFDFINGFHDAANSIATSVSTRVLTLRSAVLMAAILNFFGAVVSHAVAKTISGGLVAGTLPEYVIVAALVAGIAWDLVTWRYGIPSSSSHALIGGLIGAAIAYAAGTHNIIWSGLINKVILPLFASPVIGFVLGFLIMKLLFGLLAPFSHHFVNRWFAKLQILSASFMAFEHGRNDAQKSMGIITLALISAGVLSKGADVPVWVMLACAAAMAVGTSVGGRRIIKTMGVSMIKLEPVNGFAAETASALVIQAASSIGAPVSTTHVISSAIMGVGASKRRRAVHWGLARNIVWAWVITIPVTMFMGALVTVAIKSVV